jgi:hypothetical protein
LSDEKKTVSSQLPQHLKLKIADIIIEARCDNPDIELGTSQVSQPFLVNEGYPDCVIEVHYGPLPKMELEQLLFDSGDGPWSLCSSGQKLVLQMFKGSQGQSYVHRLAVFEPEFDKGELFICPKSKLPIPNPMPSEKERVYLDPFLTPLDELLIVNLLAQGRGLHTHALGIVHKGKGLVFCGVSGAGKSTLAELWKTREVKILSDDRISIRKQDGIIWAYGTPWHGDARISLPEKAPLEAIYFIVHGLENKILPLGAADIATRLMVRCFPTFYLKQAMEQTLSFITELAQEVPCYELQFTPDEQAIDTVLSHVENRTLRNR